MKNTSESLWGKGSTCQSWIPLLEAAAREVFELMVGSSLTAAETSFREALDVTSMIGLAGELRGVLILRCSRNSGALMAAKMLGKEPGETCPELADALGEIANMIAGNFKNKIPGLADGCMLTVPTVIIGNDYNLQSLTIFDTLDLRLLFENKPIAISLAIHCHPPSLARHPS
jgi:chemotaxis protein CheX